MRASDDTFYGNSSLNFINTNAPANPFEAAPAPPPALQPWPSAAVDEQRDSRMVAVGAFLGGIGGCILCVCACTYVWLRLRVSKQQHGASAPHRI